MPKKNNPGCNCCDTCEILTDDFARASVGSNWTQSVGTWAITSNVLVPPATGVLLTVPTSSASVDRTAAVDVVTAADGDKVRLILCAADKDNYMAVEYEPNGFSFGQEALRVVNRTAGSDAIVEEINIGDISLSTATLRACWDATNSLFGAGLTDSVGANHGTWVSGTDHGNKAGLEAIGVASGIGFDDFEFDECSPGVCILTGCTLCTRTQVVKVVISSLGNDACTTGHPNGTYLLPAGSIGSVTCGFQRTFNGLLTSYQNDFCICATPSAGLDYLTVAADLDSGSETVTVIHAGDGGFVSYTYNVNDMTGFCSGSTITDITYASATGGTCVGLGSNAWDWPNATITLERVL